MTTESKPRALVVGLGISGISTAIQLQRNGWTPVIVERAPARRSGGYFVGLFGAGKYSAERLGILDRLHNRIGDGVRTYQIDRQGRRRPGVGFADVPDAPWMMLRGDVEAAAFAELDPQTEIRYSVGPTAIIQDGDQVEVTLRSTATGETTTERFDLVVGADGLRSTVRRLVFGPDAEHLHRLNYMIAAYELPTELPGLARGEGATLTEPGRSFWVFPFADHASTVLWTWHTDDVDAEFTRTPAQRVREVFGAEPLGDTLEAAVQVLESAPAVLFDSVEQVRLERWHRGRVVLVGDSAWCVTLFAGMGVSSGIAGAELLGTALARRPGDVEGALTEWEAQLRPYFEGFQEIGIKNRAFFVPANRAESRRRRVMLRMRRSGLLARALQWLMRNNEAMRLRSADVADPAAVLGGTSAQPAVQRAAA